MQRIMIAGLVALAVVLAAERNAEARAPGYKVRMIESGAIAAQEAVAAGESPRQDCTMVAMQSRSIAEEHTDDEAAMAAARQAMEICGYEVAVAWLGAVVDGIAADLAFDPDDPRPCQTLIREFALYFNLVRGGPEQLGDDGTPLPDYETRVKAALAARAHEVCPFAAAMMGFEE